jgi:MYXO-CTERM domain-containing protein
VGSRGACVDLCSPSPCAATDTCDFRTGACVPPPPADGGLSDLPALENPTDLLAGGGGCGCRSAPVPEASWGAFGLVLLALLVRSKLAKRMT